MKSKNTGFEYFGVVFVRLKSAELLSIKFPQPIRVPGCDGLVFADIVWPVGSSRQITLRPPLDHRLPQVCLSNFDSFGLHCFHFEIEE